jgi:excisionase family DNA binding protein
MNEMREDERLLTLKETLEYLRISRTTLYRFMDEEKIEGHKIGRLWRFYLGELRRFVNGRQPVNEAANKDEQS